MVNESNACGLLAWVGLFFFRSFGSFALPLVCVALIVRAIPLSGVGVGYVAPAVLYCTALSEC